MATKSAPRAWCFGPEHAAKLKVNDRPRTERGRRLPRFKVLPTRSYPQTAQPRSSPMVRRTLITAALFMAGGSFALAQNSPLPAPQTPETKARRASPTPISPSSDLNTHRETALPTSSLMMTRASTFTVTVMPLVSRQSETRAATSFSLALRRTFLSFKSPRTRRRL